MSGLVKSVKKAFKKVVKTVKKVAPIALAVGAVVLTGGAALGALPAVGSMMGSLGLSAGLTSVLTGAVTQAGYGALIGGATSALTGGSVMKGMKGGAMAGAVTGGVTGALSAPASGAAMGQSGVSEGMKAVGQTALVDPSQVANVPGLDPVSRGLGAFQAANPASMVDAVSSASTAAAPAARAGGGLLAFAERNPLIAASVLKGVGGALMGSDAADGVKAHYKAAARNYGNGDLGGLLTQSDADAAAAQGGYGTGPAAMNPQQPLATPIDRFDPTQFAGTGRYQYDPAQGRVVYVRA